MEHLSIPSADEIRQQLQTLGHAQMRKLAEISQVPFTTLWKVRSGETMNPGVETVRQFMPYVCQIQATADAAQEG